MSPGPVHPAAGDADADHFPGTDHFSNRRRSYGHDGSREGPREYFPSIEKKYGRPIAEWKTLIRASPLTRHMELVSWLKTEHGLGHGHADALVAHTPAEDAGA